MKHITLTKSLIELTLKHLGPLDRAQILQALEIRGWLLSRTEFSVATAILSRQGVVSESSGVYKATA